MTKNPRHALVLGASGFLGSAVVQRLAAEDYRLTVLVHRHQPEHLPEGTQVLRGGLAALREISGSALEVVFHCARLRGQGTIGRYLAAWRGNLLNRRLARTLGDIPIIYASGSLMYGHCGNSPVFEDAALKPTSYAREYIIAERPIHSAAMFRPGWILGPGSWFEWFYLQPAMRGGAVPVYGSGTNVMSIIHLDDCAAAMAQVGKLARPGVYHPPSLPSVTQREFVEQVAAELKLPVSEESLAGKERAVREAFTASINLQTSQTAVWHNFHPRFTDLPSAIKHVIAAHKERTLRNASPG